MGYLKIITAILIWSSLGIFIRKIDLPNYFIVFYTSTIAGFLQCILLTTTGQFKKARQAESNSRSALFLVIAPLFFIANTLLFYFAFRNTTIANAVLTHYTAPVFVAILAPILLKEKIQTTAWIAIILSSIGLWFIFAAKNPVAEITPRFDREHLGILSGALSGLAYALLIICIRRIASLYSSLFIIFVQNGLVAIILLPFVLGTALPVASLKYLVTMGIVHSTIAPLLYVQGFRSVKANEAAILGYFEPIGATLLALIILHEMPEYGALVGGGLILFSGYMIVKTRER